MGMQIGIIANPHKSDAKAIVPEVIKWLTEKGHNVFVFEECKAIAEGLSQVVSAEHLRNNSDVILAMGGDGTLLKSARIVGSKGIPILGINLGGLGFLTEVSLDNLYPVLEKLVNKDYDIEKRMVLETTLNHQKLFALNDIVVQQSGSGRMLSVIIHVDGEYLSSFAADGIIIATPTGSTAYSMAAQGPILYPTLEAIIVNFICPHALGARPMVISKDSEIELTLKSDEAALVADGQEKMNVKLGDRISIKKAPYTINLIKSGTSFYDILRTKLRWGGGKER
jgi:NAD+ kinase